MVLKLIKNMELGKFSTNLWKVESYVKITIDHRKLRLVAVQYKHKIMPNFTEYVYNLIGVQC